MKKRGVTKLLLLILLVALVLMLPAQAFAVEKNHYVSLGDSIAVGLSAAPGHSYYDLYRAHLGSSYDSVNLALEGKTSTELLVDLATPGSETQSRVGTAKVITISIGGNNLLGPILLAVYSECGIDPTGKTTPEVEAELAAFINAHPAEWAAIVADITAKSQPGGPLYAALKAGSAQFVADWPQIMRAVNTLAPRARVHVLTVYNPLRANPALGPGLTALLVPMNTSVRLTPIKYRNVRVVGDDLLFALNPGALSFDLSKLPANTASVDPHPTTLGHWLIYRNLVVQDLLFR